MAENPQISISALAKQCEVSEKVMRITLKRLKQRMFSNVLALIRVVVGKFFKQDLRKQSNVKAIHEKFLYLFPHQ